MEMESFNKVTEASYLTAGNAWSYRAILRYFYIQHERMREFIFPEEVYDYVRELPGFGDYMVEDLHQDLDQLVRWNNLVARQEMGRSRTIEEFKKKRFRYQCTPYTVEFERMLVTMEKGGEAFGGSLEKKEFDRLYQSLMEVERLISSDALPDPATCAEVWNSMFTHFRSITQNTSDYIAHINSEKAEERMQTEAFLVFKDQFTTYLRDFIIGLQQTAMKIQNLIESVSLKALYPLIHEVKVHQESIPRFEDVGLDDAQFVEEQKEKWQSLKMWFLGNEHGESELILLEMRTNEQIRRITRVVQRLGERHHYFRSRKKDYLHLANWFESVADIREAHELSAVAFGVFHTRHLFSDQVPSEDIYSSIWNEPPVLHETNPRVRHYRATTRAGAIVNQKEQQAAVKAAHLLDKKREQATMDTFLQGNEIQVKTLPVVEPYVRKLLLHWLGKAMIRKDRTFKTEHGRLVKVHVSADKRVILRATDGEMEMPEVTFQFMDGGVGGDGA